MFNILFTNYYIHYYYNCVSKGVIFYLGGIKMSKLKGKLNHPMHYY